MTSSLGSVAGFPIDVEAFCVQVCALDATRAVPDSGFSNPAGAGFALPNPAGAGFALPNLARAGFGRSRMFINLLCDLCHV